MTTSANLFLFLHYIAPCANLIGTRENLFEKFYIKKYQLNWYLEKNTTAPVAGCDGADYSVIGSCSALLLISDSAVSRSPSLKPCVKIVTSLMLFISIQQSLIFSNVSF